MNSAGCAKRAAGSTSRYRAYKQIASARYKCRFRIRRVTFHAPASVAQVPKDLLKAAEEAAKAALEEDMDDD